MVAFYNIHYKKECYLCAVIVVETASVDAGGSSFLFLLSSVAVATDSASAITAVAVTKVADANYPAIIANKIS